MQYILDLMGRRFLLTVPYELHIGPSMAPFLWPADEENADFRILVQTGDLPLPGEDYTWHESGYFVYLPDRVQILRCMSRGSAPYAMVELHSSGEVRVTYRPDFVHFFKDAMDLVHNIGLERLVLQHDGLILHSSFIAKDGKGILFSAPSGTGKSTQAKLWQSLRDYEILNGDRAGLRKNDGIWSAWGLPYAGTSGIYRNETADIRAIVALRQGSENRISRIRGADVLRYLYPEVTVHHWSERYVNKVLDMLQVLESEVPIYLLECVPDESAVQLLERTLEKEGAL